MRVIAENSANGTKKNYHGGAVCKGLGPIMDGIGLRLALDWGILGTPWIARGSFIRAGSSFAGTEEIC